MKLFTSTCYSCSSDEWIHIGFRSNCTLPAFQDEIYLFADYLPGSTLNAIGELKWVKTAVALDSEAVKHVTPQNVFSITSEPTEKSKSGDNYYGADGSALPNLGAQKVPEDPI